MPSKSEPCGLSQLIAMRYGAVPVVNRVGGLRDTVIPYNPENGDGRGFTFETFNAYDMLDAIRRSLQLFNYDKKAWIKLVKNDLKVDFSWKNSAKKYIDMYNEVF